MTNEERALNIYAYTRRPEPDEQPAVTYSIERLVHFRCSSCGQWWSIGDAPVDRGWWCPWCGGWHPVSREE